MWLVSLSLREQEPLQSWRIGACRLTRDSLAFLYIFQLLLYYPHGHMQRVVQYRDTVNPGWEHQEPQQRKNAYRRDRKILIQETWRRHEVEGQGEGKESCCVVHRKTDKD